MSAPIMYVVTARDKRLCAVLSSRNDPLCAPATGRRVSDDAGTFVEKEEGKWERGGEFNVEISCPTALRGFAFRLSLRERHANRRFFAVAAKRTAVSK